MNGQHGLIGGEAAIVQRDARVEPGSRVVETLYYGPDPKCAGDGCAVPEADHVQ